MFYVIVYISFAVVLLLSLMLIREMHFNKAMAILRRRLEKLESKSPERAEERKPKKTEFISSTPAEEEDKACPDCPDLDAQLNSGMLIPEVVYKWKNLTGGNIPEGTKIYKGLCRLTLDGAWTTKAPEGENDVWTLHIDPTAKIAGSNAIDPYEYVNEDDMKKFDIARIKEIGEKLNETPRPRSESSIVNLPQDGPGARDKVPL